MNHNENRKGYQRDLMRMRDFRLRKPEKACVLYVKVMKISVLFVFSLFVSENSCTLALSHRQIPQTP